MKRPITESRFPRISIVTPSFNQGAFLGDTIESILVQEGEFLLDYIIVDGASTDKSLEVIRRYDALIKDGHRAARCRGIRFRWLSEKDQGQSDAIVKGFGMAEGDILSWLNSDDTLLPGALDKALGYLARHPTAGLIHGRAKYTDESGRVVDEVETGPTDYEGLASLNLICQPAAFFRRTAMDAAGALNRDLRYTMDHDLWIRMARHCGFGYIPEFLATYRLHPESKTQASACAVEFQREILDILIKHYGWAPLNRVYAYCNRVVTARFPGWSESNPLVVLPSILFTVARYLHLNRGIRVEDLKMIHPVNLRKIFQRSVAPREER